MLAAPYVLDDRMAYGANRWFRLVASSGRVGKGLAAIIWFGRLWLFGGRGWGRRLGDGSDSRGLPDKYRGLFSLARRRHRILARPNDKSGMTLKLCGCAQLQRDLKIGNILYTTKNSSASCVFIIRLLKRSGEPWLPLHRSRELPLFPKLM